MDAFGLIKLCTPARPSGGSPTSFTIKLSIFHFPRLRIQYTRCGRRPNCLLVAEDRQLEGYRSALLGALAGRMCAQRQMQRSNAM